LHGRLWGHFRDWYWCSNSSAVLLSAWK
jgi:hypothetical protein